VPEVNTAAEIDREENGVKRQVSAITGPALDEKKNDPKQEAEGDNGPTQRVLKSAHHNQGNDQRSGAEQNG
jgi:hypothetical protein